jgi:hypothetical protein
MSLRYRGEFQIVLDHQSWSNWAAPVRTSRNFGRLMLDGDREICVLRRAILVKRDEY